VGGATMSPSFTQYYHQRTKYAPETIASKSSGLDWSLQPSPYKEYKIGQSFDLKPYLQQERPSEADRWWKRLSLFLLCSYGLTIKIPTRVAPICLRAAPSAGGLYPAEIYLISRGTDILPKGLYNYQPKDHSLVHFWENDVWDALVAACGGHPLVGAADLVLVTTAVFYRSAWRYQDRAYRRICLDTGHLLGNLELSGAINGFRPCLVGGFVEEQVDELLYLDREREGSIALMPLIDLEGNLPILERRPIAIPSVTTLDFANLPDGELLMPCHRATSIETLPEPMEILPEPPLADKYNFPFCLKVSTAGESVSWEQNSFLDGLEDTILRRRSTRNYTGGNLNFSQLKTLLDFTYQPQHYVECGLDERPDYFDLGLIQSFIAVSGVDGLEEGCYYYSPQLQELRQIRFKNFRRELHYLCLGQDLGRDAAAVIFHTADLSQAIQQYGDRAYRYLHLDAGHLGQRINLVATRLGIGVSGIAGFFDDQVNEVLGIPPDEAVLYITTLGQPQD
jgi:SagB-type dehydrogenase family enzyme